MRARFEVFNESVFLNERAVRFGERVAAIFRHIPWWAYMALFLVGFGSIHMYEDGIQAEAFRRYKQTVDNVDLLPYAGVYWKINTYKVDRSFLPITNPFTTYDTYIVDVQPNGVDPAVVDCSGPIRSIQMELQGPAFSIAPTYTQSRPIENYCKSKAVTGSLKSTPIITWEVLAKQGGLHVAALRIVGLDSQEKQVEDTTIEVPIWVKDRTPLITIGTGVTVLGGLATLLSIMDRLKGRQISPK